MQNPNLILPAAAAPHHGGSLAEGVEQVVAQRGQRLQHVLHQRARQRCIRAAHPVLQVAAARQPAVPARAHRLQFSTYTTLVMGTDKDPPGTPGGGPPFKCHPDVSCHGMRPGEPR